MFEGVVQDLIDELGRLPGIGPKSAQRIAFHLVNGDRDELVRLIEVLGRISNDVRFCTLCGSVAEADLCSICADPRRDDSQLCVVEDAQDIAAIERTREFRGRYHVLGGSFDPMSGVGPEQLRVRELMTRLQDTPVTEIILALNPTLQGEATVAYLVRLLRPLELRVTRPASGLPVGGDLEYADEVTLGRALEGRQVIDG